MLSLSLSPERHEPCQWDKSIPASLYPQNSSNALYWVYLFQRANPASLFSGIRVCATLILTRVMCPRTDTACSHGVGAPLPKRCAKVC